MFFQAIPILQLGIISPTEKVKKGNGKIFQSIKFCIFTLNNSSFQMDVTANNFDNPTLSNDNVPSIPLPTYLWEDVRKAKEKVNELTQDNSRSLTIFLFTGILSMDLLKTAREEHCGFF